MAEETIGSERVYEGKIVRVRVDRIRLDDGREAKREIVEHAGAVAIVPIDADGRIVLVRQYRTPTQAALLEVPAGSIDDGEEAGAAVQRELQEETGYRAGSVRRLTGFWVAPGYCTEYIHIYAAEDLGESRLDPDEDEQIEVERHTLDEALTMVESGAICDAKSIVGLLMLARERLAGHSS